MAKVREVTGNNKYKYISESSISMALILPLIPMEHGKGPLLIPDIPNMGVLLDVNLHLTVPYYVP